MKRPERYPDGKIKENKMEESDQRTITFCIKLSKFISPGMK